MVFLVLWLASFFFDFVSREEELETSQFPQPASLQITRTQPIGLSTYKKKNDN